MGETIPKNSDGNLPVTPAETRIRMREKHLEEAQQMTLFSDAFMSVALKDRAACQYVLRILTGIQDLEVKEVRTQYRVAKIKSHDAVLDVLAEDSRGKLYNLEIQRKRTLDHARRTRFYGSMMDSEYLEKGTEYDKMPDVLIIYISKTDIWHGGKTMYKVERYFEDTGIRYANGMQEWYVNAAVDDGSRIAEMMKYFKTADPDDDSQGELSKRVHFLKREEGGRAIMCEFTDKWFAEGKIEGKKEGEEKTLINMVCRKIRKGKNLSVIADELENEEERIEPIYKASLLCAPEYDCEKIFRLLQGQ